MEAEHRERLYVVMSVFIQTGLGREHEKWSGAGKCYDDMEGLLNRKWERRFSPASLIHGELKVVETNKKGSCRSGSPSLLIYGELKVVETNKKGSCLEKWNPQPPFIPELRIWDE